MIEFTKGDMFSVPVDVRVNTVNCQGVMGAGVALAFKNRYPEMFKEYQSECREGRIRPGNLHVWKSLTGDWVINFPTKRDWRDNSRYEDIASGLEALRRYLLEQGTISVGLPALGCGHGGLDWRRVSSMIADALHDLDARILVFEPQDSRNAGLPTRNPPTDEQLKALELLGFTPLEVSQWDESKGLLPAVLSKGDASLLGRPWVALLPSREPGEREIAALGAVAKQMSLLSESVAVGLVYASHTTERIVELFLRQKVSVVLILPFGPLTRKSVARHPIENQQSSLVMVSLAAPDEKWGRPILAQSMHLLRAQARALLISDPLPEWLKEKTLKTWSQRPMFYLRYDKTPNPTQSMLDNAGARPVGRRPDTGEPNLESLFDMPASKDGNERHVRSPEHQFSMPLTAGAAAKLRNLAEAIERCTEPAGAVRITVPCRPETAELCSELERILDDSDRVTDSGKERGSRSVRHA